MKLLKPIAVLLVLFEALSLFAHGEVVLHLNALHFSAYEPIRVTVVNQESKAISVCLSQQWIPKPDGGVGTAITPLLLQTRRNRNWATVLNGVDVGPPLRISLTIEPRKSQEFELQTKGSGKARFVLYYLIGDNVNACDSPDRRKKAVSATFTLAAPP